MFKFLTFLLPAAYGISVNVTSSKDVSVDVTGAVAGRCHDAKSDVGDSNLPMETMNAACARCNTQRNIRQNGPATYLKAGIYKLRFFGT